MQSLTSLIDGISRALPQRPLVSVVMTLFNSESTLEASVSSLLDQTYQNLEIILSDDGSSDLTVRIAQRLCARDRRVRLLRFGGNHGTYWAKNFGISQCRGDVVAFADSDDLNDPRRIELQLEALRAPGAMVSTCSYSRVDENGESLPIPGSRGFAFITQMIRRDALDVIGFFDTVRTSADDEMMHRIRLVFGAAAHVNVAQRLYTALVRDGSLSHNKHNPRYSPITRGLSPARQAYASGFRGWHERLVAHGAVPYLPFPVIRRPFPVDPKLEIAKGRYASEALTVVAFSSESAPEAVLAQLERQCARSVSCSWDSAGIGKREGVGWEIQLLEGGCQIPEPSAVGRDAPVGYVIFCNLDCPLSPDVVQEAVLAVESKGRDQMVAGAGGALSCAFHTDLFAETRIIDAVLVVDATREGAGAARADHLSAGGMDVSAGHVGARTSKGGTDLPAAARLQAARPRSTANRQFAAEMWWSLRRESRETARDIIRLSKQFSSLWARSELSLAVMIFGSLPFLLLGSVWELEWISALALVTLLVAIGVGMLLVARRIRILADPVVAKESRDSVTAFVQNLRQLRLRRFRRGKMVPKQTADAILGAQVHETQAVASDSEPACDGFAAEFYALRRCNARSALARLALLEHQRMPSSFQKALPALRLILLAKTGQDVLARKLQHQIATKGGRETSERWMAVAKRAIDDVSTADEAFNEIMDALVPTI